MENTLSLNFKKNEEVIWLKNLGFNGKSHLMIKAKFIEYVGEKSARIIEDNIDDRESKHTVRISSLIKEQRQIR